MFDGIIENIESFEWDDGNNTKNYLKHKVSINEAEEMFFNKPLIILDDEKHSTNEKRYMALGKTNEGRRVFSAFTIRKNKLRVISARDMNRKEKEIYGKE